MNWLKQHTMPLLFTVAYLSFMLVSIPKIGALFLLYSGQSGPIWTGSSYGAAITIDALIGFLTYATTSKQRERGTQLGIWLFVLIFATYSFYFNWIYDELHLPPASSVWSLPSIIPGWDVQQLTTLLVSAVPLGILGFTLIARLIREEKHTVSLDELREAAANVQERAALHQVIASANLNRKTVQAKGWIQAGKEVLSALGNGSVSPGVPPDVTSHESQVSRSEELPEKLQKTIVFLADNPHGTDEELAEFLGLLRPASARFWRLKAVEVTGDSAEDQPHIGGELAVGTAEDQPTIDDPPGGDLAVGEATEEPGSLEHITEHSRGVDTQSTADVSAEEKPDDEEQSDAGSTPMGVSVYMPPFQDGSRGTVSIDDAAKLLGFSVKYVRELRSKGTLKTASRNRNRITVKSVNAVLLARQKSNQSTGELTAILQLQAVSSEQQNGHNPEPITGELPSVKIILSEQQNGHKEAG